MLAIEVDGVTHDSDSGQQHDQRRQQRLEALGVRFLRFQDEEVRQNLEGVLTGNSGVGQGEEPTPAYGHPSREGIKNGIQSLQTPSPPWRELC